MANLNTDFPLLLNIDATKLVGTPGSQEAYNIGRKNLGSLSSSNRGLFDKLMPYAGLASTAATDIASMIQGIESKDVIKNADSQINNVNASQMSAQTNGDSFDTLMSDWASNYNMNHISGKDLGAYSNGKLAGNAITSAAQGALSGLSLGPIEAIASGIGGFATSLIGGLTRNSEANKQVARVNDIIDYRNRYNLAQLNNRASNLMKQQFDTLNANYTALGGPLNIFSHGGKIYIKPENRGKFTETKKRTGKTTEELTHSKNPLTRKRAIFAQNAKNFKHAFGGELGTNGMDWTNGLMYIDNGGSHEENPYEGVVMGMDEEGNPNLVEEGETIFNDYVFSKRRMVPKSLRNKYKLGGPISFADASKQLAKESEERPNDPISQRGLKAFMADLAYAQEEINNRGNKEGNKFALGGLTLSDLRYVPAIGSAFGAIKSIIDKPDYENADAIIKAGAEASNSSGLTVGFNPIGNYLTERPFDRMFYLNPMNAQSGATRRNIINTSGMNRGTAMAGLLAADNNFLNQVGTLSRQAEEFNFNNALQVANFNRATNQYNSEGQLKADIANAESRAKSRSLGLEAITKGYQLRQAAKDTRDAAISANLTNLFDNIGNIGWEEYQRRAIESNPYLLGYYQDRSGKMGYRKAKNGGFLTIKKK